MCVGGGESFLSQLYTNIKKGQINCGYLPTLPVFQNKIRKSKIMIYLFYSFNVRIFTIIPFHNYLYKGNSPQSTYPEGLQNARCLLGKKYDFSRE